MSYHVQSDVPVGTPVLPIIWPNQDTENATGVVIETAAEARAQSSIEVRWTHAGDCLEVVGDVVLDTPFNREYMREHAEQAWCAPNVEPPVLDTVPGHRAAANLREEDRIDLEGDRYATMAAPSASAQDIADHDSTVSMFEYEYAIVETVVRETPECVVVHTSLTSFGCPPDHQIKLAPLAGYATELRELATRIATRYPDDDDAQRAAEYAAQVVDDHATADDLDALRRVLFVENRI